MTPDSVNVIVSNNRNTSMSRDLTNHLNSAERGRLKDGNKNVFVVGDSMLNNISEHGISKQHSVKVRNFPGATTERINEEIDDILQSKADLIIIHAGTDDLAKKKLTLWITWEKILKSLMSCPRTLNWLFQTSLCEKTK